MLHAEYGIVVYPSALTQDVDVHGLGIDVTFTEAYCGHIGKWWKDSGLDKLNLANLPALV